MKSFGNVLILGDSYSTFAGYIPADCAAYYSTQKGATDVDDVRQTWWWQLIEETDSNLILNSSYSGTTVCHTGYNEQDCSNISFVARFTRLIEAKFFEKNKIDTFFVFGGTNDSWAGSPLGEEKYSDWTKADLYRTLPAFGYLLDLAKKTLPNARVVAILNCDLRAEIEEGYTKVAERLGVELVALQGIDKQCGHPSVLGMKQIKEQILNFIENK